MKNILIPADFSERTRFSLAAALPLAGDEVQVNLLHAVEVVRNMPFLVTGEYVPITDEETHFNMELIRKGKDTLEQWVDRESRRREHGSIRMKGTLRVGHAAETILDYIRQSGPDLVVMGAHENPRHVYPLDGTLNDRIIRKAPCPVLTIRESPKDEGFKTIVYATAMEQEEMPMAQVVRQIAEHSDAVVHVVRINTPEDFQRDESVIGFMKTFIQDAGFAHHTLNTYNDLTVEDGILNFSRTIGADLVAMVTHGRGAISRLLSGSVAEGVVAQSKTPILTQLVGRSRSVASRKD